MKTKEEIFIEIRKKRWEDWKEFNAKAQYPIEHESSFADGFTRGATWMMEQLKTNNMKKTNKTLTNTTANLAKDNVKDIEFWGNGDTFKLISKAHSVNEGWMKSTKAMEIKDIGCVVQVTTQQYDNVAEALTFVPNVKIAEYYGIDGKVVGRQLVKI